MIEIIVSLLGAVVGIVGSLLTTSFKLGGEKQSRLDLTQRHNELAKELRGEIVQLKVDRDRGRDKDVELEKASLTIGQRAEALQTQLANKATLDAERMEHLRQQLESKASAEMVAGLKQQIERVDQKIDGLHEQLAVLAASRSEEDHRGVLNTPPARRRR